jgi:small-conductance mechanosensitive channel
MIKRGLVLFLGFLFIIHAAVAGAEPSFDSQARQWNNQLTAMDRAIAKNEDAITPEQTKTWRETLRTIRADAKQQADLALSQKQSQTELLSALGPDPQKGEPVDYRIEAQRKKLKNTIVEIDSRNKRATLALSKAQELMNLLDDLEKKALRDTLLTRLDWSTFSFDGFLTDASAFFNTFGAWDRVAMVILVMAILGYIQTQLPPLSQKFMETAGALNTRRLFYGLMLAVMTFALRVHLFGSQGFVHDVGSVVFTLALAGVMLIVLKPLRFRAPSGDDDDFHAEKKADHTWIGNGFLFLMRLALVCVFPAILLGYVSLAVYLAFNVTVTLVAMLSFGVFRHAFLWIMRRISSGKDKTSGSEKSALGIVILEPVLALFLFMVALSFWGMPPKSLEAWMDQYGSGLTIGKVTFDFLNIGSAISIFFILYVATRITQWFFSERVLPYTRVDGGLKNAVHALTGYVGMGIAILSGMSALGLNMENLAIVLGALSVGIGFGLQAVTSNFISGIILLFERPIRVGDWIALGEHQGVVRKIRVRSTEIETFQNASIIVPNSQLVTETVTNWMLHDTVARLDITVGVAYDSDLKRVKDILIAAAQEHPEVRRKPQPFVLLKDFGESALQLELRCFVKNVFSMQGVGSDIRTRIYEQFQKDGIEIPYPKRSIHVTASTPEAAIIGGA